MRFIPRALTGFSMMVISVGLIGGGVWRIMNAAPEGGRPSGGTTPAPTVELVQIERIEARPTLELQGRIRQPETASVSLSRVLGSIVGSFENRLRVQAGSDCTS